jgi:photosystem II stability/assembly factor-like uncharacterized protein
MALRKNTKSLSLGRWTPQGLSGGGGTEAGAISPHDPNFMILNCDMSGVYRSFDGGKNWQQIPFQQLQACIFCRPVFHPTDPSILYAGDGYAARLKISRDQGTTWSCIGRNLPLGLRALAIDPIDPSRLLAGHLEGVSYSANHGMDWQSGEGIHETVTGLYVSCVAVGPSRPFFAVTARAIYRSLDEGRTWQTIAVGLPPGPVLAFAGSSIRENKECILYAWIGGKRPEDATIVTSTDIGDHWQIASTLAVHPGTAPSDAIPSTRLLSNDTCTRTVYAVKKVFSSHDTVLRSDDQGRSWRPVAFTDPGDARYNMPNDYINGFFLPKSLWGWDITHAGIDPCNIDRFWFAHYCTGFVTADGGRTWTSYSTRPAPGQKGPRRTWRWVNNGLNITTTWNYYVDPHAPRRHFIAYTDLGMAQSSDEGLTWIYRRDIGCNTYEMAYDPDVPGQIWAAFGLVHDIPCNNIILKNHSCKGAGCVGFSKDGGDTWFDLCRDVPVDESDFYRPDFASGYEARRGLPPTTVLSIVLDPKSPPDKRRLFAACWESGVFCSDDGGKTWIPRSKGLGSPDYPLRAIRLILHPDGTLFCLVTTTRKDKTHIRDGVGLFVSGDQGRTWREATSSLDIRWTTDFAVDPRDSRIQYVSAADHIVRQPGSSILEVGSDTAYVPVGGLYRTTDGGKTWTRLIRKGLRHFGVTLHPDNPDWIYMTLHATVPEDIGAAPEASLWLSRNGGTRWEPFLDYPFGNPARVHFHPQDRSILFVTSFGGSIYRGPSEPE